MSNDFIMFIVYMPKITKYYFNGLILKWENVYVTASFLEYHESHFATSI